MIPGFGRGYDSLSGLLLALVFWAVLTFALLNTVLWPEWLPARMRTITWFGVLGIWAASVIRAKYSQRKGDCKTDPPTPGSDRFPEFLEHYLRGEWDVLKTKLPRHLQRCPHDLEARLLWASTLRRLGEIGQARRQLELIRQADATGSWVLELHREKALLRNLEREFSAHSSDPALQSPTGTETSGQPALPQPAVAA